MLWETWLGSRMCRSCAQLGLPAPVCYLALLLCSAKCQKYRAWLIIDIATFYTFTWTLFEIKGCPRKKIIGGGRGKVVSRIQFLVRGVVQVSMGSASLLIG